MCYYARQFKLQLEQKEYDVARFNIDAKFEAGFDSAYAYPAKPVIVSKDMQKIEIYNWALIPSRAKDTSFRKNTLNAKIETLTEKPSFKNCIDNRCIILVDGFF